MRSSTIILASFLVLSSSTPSFAQDPQKPRDAIFEDTYCLGASPVQRTCSTLRLNQAARVFPKASWHMRQWQ